MSVMNDSVTITTETQSSTDSFSLAHSTDSRDISRTSVTTSITTGDTSTNITTDGHLVGSVGTEAASDLYSQSYTTGFSQSKATSTESDNSSYTSFEKARFIFV